MIIKRKRGRPRKQGKYIDLEMIKKEKMYSRILKVGDSLMIVIPAKFKHKYPKQIKQGKYIDLEMKIKC